jgi:hypothetical protein
MRALALGCRNSAGPKQGPLSNPGKGLEKMFTDSTYACETFALVPSKLVIAYTSQQELAVLQLCNQ